jgi:hypothetical protein
LSAVKDIELVVVSAKLIRLSLDVEVVAVADLLDSDNIASEG